ncbi:MAG TPA: cysteine--tRNA ligase [Flavobacteriales bacterium]|nr:cysteine--tRNA ligase [Flavobacteriales bacterium]
MSKANQLKVYNTLTRQKEVFEPLSPPHVGMYVCGPTVYGDPHLGHARSAIVFDIVFRYLKHHGYKVRYVRNITDVGHLENDGDMGEDKIAKKARLEQLEPMEIVQIYTDQYHKNMAQLNLLNPSIEPRASGHIIEQIEMIQKLLKKDLAYEVKGSIYFNVVAYDASNNYGKLSGRKIEELMKNTRKLEGQEDKKNPFDFALWKKAQPEHIMKWPSPWSLGFPGWHLECSVMGAKYLGTPFDIHGGGLDLLFPHHECEIAQSQAANDTDPVKYWLHNNMITINSQKMSKSLGNFITLDELFTGSHNALEQAYSPMTVRFFILQAHYRGTLDFSNKALQAAEKGLNKLLNGISTLKKLKSSNSSSSNINKLKESCETAMKDDFNTSILISCLFEGVRIINSVNLGEEKISSEDLDLLKSIFEDYAIKILGFTEKTSSNDNSLVDPLMDLILDIRQEARSKQDYEISDKIREALTKMKIVTKDEQDGTSWNYEE